jgi:hypothetical protein
MLQPTGAFTASLSAAVEQNSSIKLSGPEFLVKIPFREPIFSTATSVLFFLKDLLSLYHALLLPFYHFCSIQDAQKPRQILRMYLKQRSHSKNRVRLTSSYIKTVLKISLHSAPFYRGLHTT